MARSLTLYIRTAPLAVVATIFTALFTSCFTGVESTKTITLSRQDLRRTALTPEDTLISRIKGIPMCSWQSGRRFLITDNKVSVMLVPRTLPADSTLWPRKGMTLVFDGISEERHPDGSVTAAVRLRNAESIYLYDTGIAPQKAKEDFDSFSMQTLLDMESMSELDHLLHGKVLWTRTQLWYDRDGNPQKGRKFVPVTVISVTPGGMVYPLKVTFADHSGTAGSYLMSLPGASASASRRFQDLFTLTDPYGHYQGIDPEVWALVQNGDVRVGMTKEECRLSWGEPQDSDSGRNYTSILDVWKYDGGRYLMFENGLLTDYHK